MSDIWSCILILLLQRLTESGTHTPSTSALQVPRFSLAQLQKSSATKSNKQLTTKANGMKWCVTVSWNARSGTLLGKIRPQRPRVSPVQRVGGELNRIDRALVKSNTRQLIKSYRPDFQQILDQFKNIFGTLHMLFFPPSEVSSKACCTFLSAAFGASEACEQASDSRFTRIKKRSGKGWCDQ